VHVQAAASSAPASPTLADVGVIAIGRNEGERLRRCFDALPTEIRHVVYVDSASTDDSVEQARRRGIDVLELDMSIPFTAARARNAGLRRLRERHPRLEFVQIVDGDCALAPGWLEAGIGELHRAPRLAVVCGRRRELHRDASIYNRLCDMEWDTPIGDAESCGGDALARTEAIWEVGGYHEGLIAGEEPEMCARLRSRGWGVRRIDHEMTLHDAAMSRFVQWWRRTLRAGHAFADVSAIHPALWRREVRSSLAWGLAVPVIAVLAASVSGWLGLGLLGAYPALWGRIFQRRARRDTLRDAALYSTFCVLGKFPESAGALKFWWNRRRGRRSKLIEYK
jgi:glycosyltransferase involved in cell wall biosynthesis